MSTTRPPAARVCWTAFSAACVYPHAPGPFIRRRCDAVGYECELVVGQWGLIPWFAKEPKLKFPTNNARSEELEQRRPATRIRGSVEAWPALHHPGRQLASTSRTGRAGRTCGGPSAAPTARRGAWQAYGTTGIDKVAGEVHENYTMLTINADAHPLMSRVHRPDPKLAPDKQDKRSVIPLEADEFDKWLEGTVEQAKPLMQLAPSTSLMPTQHMSRAPSAPKENSLGGNFHLYKSAALE
jgi:putative SOS response-associated peptidase YedK